MLSREDAPESDPPFFGDLEFVLAYLKAIGAQKIES
jgi:hypothetical protein